MAVTVITGPQATDTINASQIPPEMDNVIHQLDPNVAPFTTMLQKMRKKVVQAPKVEWLQQQRMPRFTTLSASAASNATTLGVTADIFRVGDVIRITTTGETVEVTATAAGLLTGTRAIGVAITAGLSAASLAEVFIVNNVNSEGASLREIKTPKVDNVLNYCQIVRTPTGLTGTDAATKQYGGVSRDYLRQQALFEHQRNLEGMALMGPKRIDTTTTGKPKRFGGGATDFITTNVTNVGGTMSEATFQTILRSAFRYGSDRKVLLASPLVMGVFDGYARANIHGGNFADTANQYGVQLKTYVSSQGIVDIVGAKWFLDSAAFKGWFFIFDFDNVAYAELRGTRLLTDRQAPDADQMIDEYLTEACCVFINEPTHAWATGITG